MDQLVQEISNCKRRFPGHIRLTPSQSLEELSQYMHDQNVDFDLYGQGVFLNQFEQEISSRFGFEAGLFAPSGTMLQGIACRIYSERRGFKTIGLHSSSHLLADEHFAIQHLHDLNWQLIGQPQKTITIKDVENLPSTLACSILELPMRRLGSQTIPWKELVKIKDVASYPLHLDGARIWEIQPWYGRDFKDICAGFSSVYVSFYKGVGAYPGAMLLGSHSFIKEARLWLRRYGGNLFQQTIAAASAKLNLSKKLPRFSAYFERTKQIASLLGSLGYMVSPEEIQSCAFLVSTKGSTDTINKKLQTLRTEKSIHLCHPFSEGAVHGVCTTEINVGEATLEWSDQDVRDHFSFLLAK